MPNKSKLFRHASNFVFIAFLLLMPNARLQAQGRSSYSFSIFVDPQVTWLHSDNPKKIDGDGSMVTLNVGFEGDKYFARRYAITSGVSLNSIGGYLKIADTAHVSTVNGDYTLKSPSRAKFRGQYISVPLGFKFRSTQIGYFSFYASVGVKGHVRLRGYTWADADFVEPSENGAQAESIEKERSNDYFQLVFGSYYMNLGAEYSLGGDSQSAIQMGLSYTGGFTSIIKTTQLNDAIDASVLGQAIALRIGFVF